MTDERMLDLLAPYLNERMLPQSVMNQLQAYLKLLSRWNEKTNLTAIRDAETIVSRHFGESLFAARMLAPRLEPDASLLDFGSGAGFPGLPIQIFCPHFRVTLAESQNKKATFLREVVRSLGLQTAVFAGRAETMAPGTCFDCVVMRAVDRMESAVEIAQGLCASNGLLALLTTSRERPPRNGKLISTDRLPGADDSELQIYGF